LILFPTPFGNKTLSWFYFGMKHLKNAEIDSKSFAKLLISKGAYINYQNIIVLFLIMIIQIT